MSTVQRILDASDQTFAHRDVLALLAYVFDMRGCTAADLANVATDLGLAETVDFDPKTHPGIDALPGDRITKYGDHLMASLAIGRERLAERFPLKAN